LSNNKQELIEEVKKLFGCWDNEVPNPVYLILKDVWDDIPDGTAVISFDNEVKTKGKDEIDLDYRFGRLAYGLNDELFEKLDYKQLETIKFRCEEIFLTNV
jgi:hypothetical protein